jgi:hypothetical protein
METVKKICFISALKCSGTWYLKIQINSKGFWRWCVTLITTGFLDFVHRPEFYNQENTTFRKLDLFPSSGEGGGAPTLLGTLQTLLANPVWIFLPFGSPLSVMRWPNLRENRNISSLVLFPFCLRARVSLRHDLHIIGSISFHV